MSLIDTLAPRAVYAVAGLLVGNGVAHPHAEAIAGGAVAAALVLLDLAAKYYKKRKAK